MHIRVTDQGKTLTFRNTRKKLLALIVAGGAAFWITDFLIAVSPISEAYKAAFSISSLSLALVEALVGGLLMAFSVSYLLLHFFTRKPGNNPIQKALILSFSAMIVIEVLSTIGNPAHAFVYLVLDTGMNIPRFLALGWTIGFVFDKQNRKVLR
jgi:hypothetical protein